MPENSPSDRPAPSDSPAESPPGDVAASNAAAVTPSEVGRTEAVERESVPLGDGRVPGRGFWASVGWLVLFQVVAALLGLAVAVAVSAGRRGLFPDMRTAWVAEAVASVSVLFLAYLNLGRRMPRALAVRRPRLLHAALVVLAVPALIVISSNVSGLTQRGVRAARGAEALPHAGALVVGAAGPFERLESLYEELGRQPFLVVLFLGCLCPGVAEEVLCRGFLGRGLVARFGVVWGVLLTSLLFGLMHVIPALVCATIVMGVVLHFVYLTTRSLVAPVLLHTLNNFVALNHWRLTQDTGFAESLGEDGVNLPLFLAAVAALAGLGAVLYRTRVRWVLPDQTDWNPGYPTAETPPADWHAVPRRRPAGRRAGLAAVGTYLLFGATCALTAINSPPSAWASFQQGTQAYERHDFDMAIERFSEVVRRRPDYAWAYNGRGLALGMKGDHAGAIGDLTEAIRLEPTVTEFYANRGWAHNLRGDFAEARRDCNQALRRDPTCAFAAETRADACYALGDQAYDRADFDEAIALFDEAIASNPRFANAYCFRGIALGKKGDHADAIRDLTEAIRLDPTVAEFYADRAWAHKLRGDFADARRDSNEALRRNPASAFAAQTRAAACYALGRQAYAHDDFDEAIARYGEAIESNPHFASAYSGRAMSRGMRGDAAGALQDIDEAIRLDPKVAEFHANRAWAHSLRGELAEAVRDVEHALRLDAKCAFAVEMGVSAHTRLWKEAYARRDADEVIAHTTAAIRLKPDFHPAYGSRGVALAMKGNHADALRDLTEAIRMQKAEVYYANRAWVHNLQWDFTAAFGDCNQALALNPKSPFALQQRAEAISGLVGRPFLLTPLLP